MKIYNRDKINHLISYIGKLNGTGNKDDIAKAVQKEFSLLQDGKVFSCEDFAIRFGLNGKNAKKKISNTVLALSKIRFYDDRPLIFCIVTHEINHLLMINTTFLKKISHSSQKLDVDNIRGSINCSDIEQSFAGLDNEPDNFEELYAYHAELSFQDNLERLVAATRNIEGKVLRFTVDATNRDTIEGAASRASQFIHSPEYNTLKSDLASRVKCVQGEIAIAAFIDNVNLRGRVIEYLITDEGSTLKDQIISALNTGSPLPSFKTTDELGDYSYTFPTFDTATDIKTKVLFLRGNPKAYNVDKLLKFLAKENSVYMICLIGVDENGKITLRLFSSFDEKIINATKVQHHWAGRNSRGGSQFEGAALRSILLDSSFKPSVNVSEAREYIRKLIDLGNKD